MFSLACRWPWSCSGWQRGTRSSCASPGAGGSAGSHRGLAPGLESTQSFSFSPSHSPGGNQGRVEEEAKPEEWGGEEQMKTRCPHRHVGQAEQLDEELGLRAQVKGQEKGRRGGSYWQRGEDAGPKGSEGNERAQEAVGGSGVRQRGSLRRLLADTGMRDGKGDLAQCCGRRRWVCREEGHWVQRVSLPGLRRGAALSTRGSRLAGSRDRTGDRRRQGCFGHSYEGHKTPLEGITVPPRPGTAARI